MPCLTSARRHFPAASVPHYATGLIRLCRCRHLYTLFPRRCHPTLHCRLSCRLESPSLRARGVESLSTAPPRCRSAPKPYHGLSLRARPMSMRVTHTNTRHIITNMFDQTPVPCWTALECATRAAAAEGERSSIEKDSTFSPGGAVYDDVALVRPSPLYMCVSLSCSAAPSRDACAAVVVLRARGRDEGCRPTGSSWDGDRRQGRRRVGARVRAHERRVDGRR